MASLANKPAQRIGNTIGWGVMVLLSIAIALAAALPYAFNPALATSGVFEGRFENGAQWLYIHAFAAGLALLLGPFQFIKKLRDSRPVIHRWTGRVYLVGILAGSISGLIIAQGTTAGLTGRFGFSMLALIWFYTGLRAYISIRGGRTEEHKRWMIRNFSLTFAAVTLRLWIGIGMAVQIGMFGIPEEEAFVAMYQTVPWLSWVPNIIVAQAIIDKLDKRRLHKRSETMLQAASPVK